MLVDNIVVSTHWGIIYNSRYYFLLPTYDSSNEWNKYSTGRLLQEKLLQWSIDEGIKIFDFTIGAENYKKIWSNNSMRIFEMVKLIRVNGLLYYVITHLVRFIKNNSNTRIIFMNINKSFKKYFKS